MSSLRELLDAVTDPHSGKTLRELKAVVQADENHIHLRLPFHFELQKESWVSALRQKLEEAGFEGKMPISVESRVLSHRVQPNLTRHPEIKNIIAIGSGKGGVGKSTVAVNLALALLSQGARVGILDADIYGPSQPMLLGITENPNSPDQRSLMPLEKFNLQTMSIGYLVDIKTALIWRGPMVSGALQQLLNDTLWHQLDYLIVDLPPGTGDIQLTLAQKIPVAGAVVVTTPQDLSLLDARRAIKMFEKVHIPVLGIVENMSTFVCPKCGECADIFGHGGGEALSKESGVHFLGSIPLTLTIREQSDRGIPMVIAEPNSMVTAQYQKIAMNLAAGLSTLPKSYGVGLPKVVVESRPA